MGANKFHKKGLTIVQQISSMGKFFPSFDLSWKKGVVCWIGLIQPTKLSETYKIKVKYSFGSVPKVWVLSPQLVPRSDNERIPHIYSGKRLCLYLPGAGDWNKNMLIAETIIPWTSLWLYHYEIWHATGEWLGGGVHPSK